MSISVNGHSSVPPGFRFHPTEEELLNYYLTNKVVSEKIDMDVIRDVDLNKLEPWDIEEKCKIGSNPQNDLYFFSHKDKKYPTGIRTNRATAAGFWKATGRDKVIYTSFKRIGMRKTLVFYKGRAPNGKRSDWIMHEYRLDDHPEANSHSHASSSIGESAAQEYGWVICRVFKKKIHQKALDSPNNCSSITSEAKTQMMHSSSDGELDQILQYMGRSCKQETEAISNMNISNNGNNDITMRYLHESFMKQTALESPLLPSLPIDLPPPHDHPIDTVYTAEQGVNNWATLDSLVASHLNGDNLSFASPHDYHHGGGGRNGDIWSFTQSASTPSCTRLMNRHNGIAH